MRKLNLKGSIEITQIEHVYRFLRLFNENDNTHFYVNLVHSPKNLLLQI